LKSAPHNLKATRDSIVSLFTLLHQLLLLTPERSQDKKKNCKSTKADGEVLAAEKVADGLHDKNELICFGL
jgi:hypothetical protein